jgi:transglutaminase/protease-like cytokinesis protein 3
MAEETEVRRLVTELHGNRCRCGAPKKSGDTFCWGCYFKLSPAMRVSLYRSICNGYEEAYSLACRVLDLPETIAP